MWELTSLETICSGECNEQPFWGFFKIPSNNPRISSSWKSAGFNFPSGRTPAKGVLIKNESI